MNLGVDARWMVGQYRGMGRYAHALLEPVSSSVKALLPSTAMDSIYPNIKQGSSFFPLWEQVTLPKLCSENSITDLLCPYNTAPLHLGKSTRLILVVHDLIYLESWRNLPPSVSAYQTLGRIYRRALVPRVIRNAHRLVTVSEFTKQQICHSFSIPDKYVTVIPNMLDDDWYAQAPLPVAEKHPYILAVSGEAPSKNLDRLIQSFSRFKKRLGKRAADCQLRVVGIKPKHHAEFNKLAEQRGVGSSVKFESFIGTEVLKKLYREARLFVMPSLFEGFGIPLLEAMASGTAIACSNTTSMPEVAGDVGWLFDPRDSDQMCDVISMAWEDDIELQERAAKGLVRAQHYRQASITPQVVDFWKSL